MAYEIKDFTGSVFAAKDKKTDKHPDREGSCKIDGVEYWIAGWIKQDKNGNPWLSLSFKPKQATAMQEAATPAKPSIARRSSAEMDDEIPF